MHVAVHIQSESESHRVAQLFDERGARCERFQTAASLMHAANHRAFDALVLDARGATPAGVDALVSWVRCRPCPTTPVMLLHAHGGPQHVVHALESGADDVLAAPFAPEELVARVRAGLRRTQRAQAQRQRVELAGFALDHDAGWLLDRGRMVELTPREFALAWFLFSNPSCFSTREAISHAVWGAAKDIVDHTVEQHIYKLRKKLGLCRERGVWIRAAYGRGYRLELHEEPEADFGSSMPAALDEHASALHIAALIESSWSSKRLSTA